MHLTNKYWKLYRKYGDRNDKTGALKIYANTCAYTGVHTNERRTARVWAKERSKQRRTRCVCALCLLIKMVCLCRNTAVYKLQFSERQNIVIIFVKRKNTRQAKQANTEKKKHNNDGEEGAMKRSKSNGRAQQYHQDRANAEAIKTSP